MMASGSSAGPLRVRRQTDWVALSLGLVVILGTACSAPSGVPALLSVVQVDSWSVVHVLSGRLVARDSQVLKAPDSRVHPLQVRWVVENGSRVKAGDLLFEFDNSQLVQALEQREFDLTAALTSLITVETRLEAELAQLEADQEKKRAERDKARIDAEIPPELKSEAEFERLQLALERAELELSDSVVKLAARRESATAELRIEELGFEKAQLALEREHASIERLAVRAPRDGVVLLEENNNEDRLWAVGDTTWAGQSLASVPDLDSMMVEALLFDVDDGRIRQGQSAVVTFDAFPDQSFPASVGEIERVAISQSSRSTVRTFLVSIVGLDLPEAVRRPGLSARVEVQLPELPVGDRPLLLVPRESLIEEPAGSRLVLSDGTRVAVELGGCDALYCALVAGEVEAGTRLGRAEAGALSGQEAAL